ncbi:MAG TPA: PAC2 family protein [Candidatus Bathyarchaeia archaeon]|nr:PAC2 family protein [Candidatus Bathyarchaeia archaeon]
MVCTVHLTEKPTLNDPILIEGLPGIGFVANIAALHLINELNAPLFGEIHSSSFQDLAITSGNGKARFPTNELYYHKAKNNEERDLIILYGNTQALTTTGQYELAGKTLDTAKDLNCHYVITLGGLRREEKITKPPKLYCAASDPEALKDALNIGAEIIEGQIFGIAGLLIGLSPLWNIHGFCLLAETPGFHADATAAREVLTAINKMLHLQADMTHLDKAVESTREILKSFGLLSQTTEEKRKEEPSGWRI